MKKAVALILMIFLMLMCSLAALVAFSLLTRGTEGGLGFSQSIQAHAIAIGGKEWYLEQLENDSDWSNEVSQIGIALGSGNFDITVNSASGDSVSFTVTGKIQGPSNQIAQRQISLTVRKYLKPFLFALFWGRDTGSRLQLRNSQIDGNLWSRGTTEVRSGSSVSGIAYCPDIEDIIGSGTFTKQKINRPYPDMPQIDEDYYNDLMSSFNSYINKYGTNKDRNQNRDLVLNGDIIGCRNFITDGNITISGHGYIVARRDIRLHSTNEASGHLTISPSGGNIYFLASRTLTVNSTRNDTNVTMYGGAYLYSRARTNTNQRVLIRKHPSTVTDINSAFIIARRRITVQNGSQLTNCTLYVSDVSDRNNYLQIRHSGTSVSGKIISVSDSDPGLIITDNASVTGLVYHWGDDRGYTNLNNVRITGSVLASQFRRNRIRDCVVTYNPASLPPTLPIGFPEEVVVESDSWDDN